MEQKEPKTEIKQENPKAKPAKNARLSEALRQNLKRRKEAEKKKE